MVNMMNGTGFGLGLTTLWGIHLFASVIFLAGFILLIVWAVKTLNQGQLKTWGITLVLVGALACLLSVGAIGSGWSHGSPQTNTMHMDMMEEMMGSMDDQEHNAHMNMRDDPMSMSMNDMSFMLAGKTGDEFDRAFIEGMIPHHQGAIDMAREAQKSAKHEEIRRMADAIISAQQQEIDQMNQWMRDWGYTN